MITGEYDILYSQTSASGSWGYLTNITVKNLNDYKFIIVAVYDGRLFSPSFVPISLFKASRITSIYIANQYSALAEYINDTTIGISMVGMGIFVAGVK